MVTPLTTPPTPTEPSSVVPIVFHAIMDCAGCDLTKIQDQSNITAWITDLLSKLEITTEDDIIFKTTTVGITAIQIADTFSIDALFVDESKHVYLDVFSCAQFNPELVETSLKEFFGSSADVKKILIPRNATV